MFDSIDLTWLMPAGDTLQTELNALSPETPDLSAGLQNIAALRLNSRQAMMFNRKLTKLRSSNTNLSGLSSFSLAILSNKTIDLVVDQLSVAAARHGVNLSVRTGNYDQVLQEALNPEAEVFKQNPNAVLLMLDHEWFGRRGLANDSKEFVRGAAAQINDVLDALEKTCPGVQVILQTIAPPPLSLFGSFDRKILADGRDVDALNARIVSIARDQGHLLLDVATMAEKIGTERYHDPVARNLYKLPMAQNVVPLFVDWLGRLISAIRGKSRKCLVLDLDNTLWGGAIGDDGLEGIVLGQGNAQGEAFLAVQKYALDLKNRGIILAVCSKNNEDTARSAFREHPEMLLKESDISVFQANWEDKASNIEAIAVALNIGLDSLVFLDDNPVERAVVRRHLPMVAVPEVGDDPAYYPFLLAAAGYFEAISFSDEDRLRVESYTADAFRAEVESKSRSLGDYLQSLEMQMKHAAFNKADRSRIVQLINKTNQFNLTTRRYTEAEVIAMEESGKVFGRYCRLRDKFSDFGIIGIVIARETSETVWEIDSWLMSCRVLGRQVESKMLDDLVSQAKQYGVQEITSTYVPTPKNGMVADHYEKLGFERLSGNEKSDSNFRLRIADYKEISSPIGDAN